MQSNKTESGRNINLNRDGISNQKPPKNQVHNRIQSDNVTSEFYQTFKVLLKKLKRGKHFQHHTGQNQKRTLSEKKTTNQYP